MSGDSTIRGGSPIAVTRFWADELNTEQYDLVRAAGKAAGLEVETQGGPKPGITFAALDAWVKMPRFQELTPISQEGLKAIREKLENFEAEQEAAELTHLVFGGALTEEAAHQIPTRIGFGMLGNFGKGAFNAISVNASSDHAAKLSLVEDTLHIFAGTMELWTRDFPEEEKDYVGFMSDHMRDEAKHRATDDSALTEEDVHQSALSLMEGADSLFGAAIEPEFEHEQLSARVLVETVAELFRMPASQLHRADNLQTKYAYAQHVRDLAITALQNLAGLKVFLPEETHSQVDELIEQLTAICEESDSQPMEMLVRNLDQPASKLVAELEALAKEL